MAKRKRLTPPLPETLEGSPMSGTMSATTPDQPGAGPYSGGLETKALFGRGPRPPSMPQAPYPAARAPISHVAGDAATAAALSEVAGELAAARAEGRLVLRLPLGAVDPAYLLRDRLEADPEEMQSLIESLRLNGQRSPVEVVELAPGRFGLISGWRRLLALRRLLDETGEARFATVLAFLRRPDTAADAYVAMVEENEIRVGLSYYERARIAAKAVEAGVFATERLALQRLYAAASRPRRSKIGSFLAIYHALDGALRFPAALSERLGLGLARMLDEDPGQGLRLRTALLADPAASPEAERDHLLAVLDPAPPGAARSADAQTVSGISPSAEPDRAGVRAGAPPRRQPVSAAMPAPQGRAEELSPGVFLQADFGPDGGPGRLELSGPGIDRALAARLRHWLRQS